MAAFRVTVHHDNFTAVGRGWNVTEANKRALRNYLEIEPDGATMLFLQELANEARSARRGGVGEVKWRIDRDKSFIIVERC